MEYKLDEAERKLVLDTLHYVSLHAYEDLMIISKDGYPSNEFLIASICHLHEGTCWNSIPKEEFDKMILTLSL